MAKLIIHQEKVTDNQELVKICPFGAMEEKDGKLTINAACKMCRLCVKKGPEGAVEYVEDTVRPSVDKEEWKGIAVYVDHVEQQDSSGYTGTVRKNAMRISAGNMGHRYMHCSWEMYRREMS